MLTFLFPAVYSTRLQNIEQTTSLIFYKLMTSPPALKQTLLPVVVEGKDTEDISPGTAISQTGPVMKKNVCLQLGQICSTACN